MGNQDTERIRQIRKNLEIHDTQFLLDIWQANNHREWTPEAFEAIREILLERIESLPPQKTWDSREAIQPRDGEQKLLLTRLEGSVELEHLSPEDAHHIIHHLSAALSAQRATDIHSEKYKVTFQVSMFRFVSNWNVLEPVDGGEFIAHPGAPGTIEYRFSLVRMFVSTTIITIIFSLTILLRLGLYISAVIVIPLVVWLFFFGLNYIIAVWRLQNFVWHTIEHSSNFD
jgi:hypothetical protein